MKGVARDDQERGVLMRNDHFKPGRYLMVTGEVFEGTQVAYWVDFPNKDHVSFPVVGDEVRNLDGVRVSVEWYFLNEITLYSTLESVIPEDVVKRANVLETFEARFARQGEMS
jgi:hypothetical protein